MDDLIKTLEITLEKKAGTIKSTDSFRSYSEWDSLMVFAILSMVDEEYGISINRKEFELINTVQELFNLMESRRNK